MSGFVETSIHRSSKFEILRPVNENQVYATFLSTRIGNDRNNGEFEQDWYFNSTRVLIHRLLRNPNTRGSRRIVVRIPLVKRINAHEGPGNRERSGMEEGTTRCRRCSRQTCAYSTCPGSHRSRCCVLEFFFFHL